MFQVSIRIALHQNTPKELKDLDLTAVLHQVDVPVKQ